LREKAVFEFEQTPQKVQGAPRVSTKTQRKTGKGRQNHTQEKGVKPKMPEGNHLGNEAKSAVYLFPKCGLVLGGANEKRIVKVERIRTGGTKRGQKEAEQRILRLGPH